MTLAAEHQMEHIGETCGCADHDYDLVLELGKRLQAVWRFDQYIANAEDKPQMQKFWRELKKQEQENIRRIKALMKQEIEAGCF